MMEVLTTITRYILTVVRDIPNRRGVIMIIQPTITIKEVKAYHRLHYFMGKIIIRSSNTMEVTTWAMNLIMVNIETATCQR